ncbi:SgcJ/EcaC family oxidoreductase [Nonomuraea sp. NPDC002799]
MQAEERALLAVFDATSRAWAEGDANAFVTSYAEDATVILPGVYLRGRADVRTGMGHAFAGPLKGSRRVHEVESVRFLGGDAAIVVTRSATTFPDERWESATWALSRSDCRWLVRSYHSCPPGG